MCYSVRASASLTLYDYSADRRDCRNRKQHRRNLSTLSRTTLVHLILIAFYDCSLVASAVSGSYRVAYRANSSLFLWTYSDFVTKRPLLIPIKQSTVILITRRFESANEFSSDEGDCTCHRRWTLVNRKSENGAALF